MALISSDENLDMYYSFETAFDHDFFDHDHKNGIYFKTDDINVIGVLRKPVRYSLNELMIKSAVPKYKQVINSLVIDTVQKDSREGFKCLLFKNYLIQSLNDKNQTALHLAHYSESKGIIAEFEEYLQSDHCKEPDYIDYIDINGLSHLHIACAYGSLKLIENYCKNSANINTHFVAPNEKNVSCYNGFTPLHFVMINFSHHSKEMVELLVKYGSDVNAVDSKGRTPLHLISCISEHSCMNTLQIIKALINSGADVNAKDTEGNTPLFMVFSLLFEESVHLKDEQVYNTVTDIRDLKLMLLLQKGANVNIRNNNNDTILHFVVNHLKIFGYTECNEVKTVNSLKLIMSACKDIDVNVKNNDGDTPLKLAISCLSVRIVQFFLKHNVDFTSLNFDCKTREFFKFPNGIISFEHMQKLLAILKLLWNEGCILKPKDNLSVLKFLLHREKNSFIKNFGFKSDKGTVKENMTRFCVIKLSHHCIIKSHSTPLPYDCYELVTNHLSNRDILNLCLALLT